MIPQFVNPTLEELLQVLRDTVVQLENIIEAIAKHPDFTPTTATQIAEAMTTDCIKVTATVTYDDPKPCRCCGKNPRMGKADVCGDCITEHLIIPSMQPPSATDAPRPLVKICQNCSDAPAITGYKLCNACAHDIYNSQFDIDEPIEFAKEATEIMAYLCHGLNDDDDAEDEPIETV